MKRRCRRGYTLMEVLVTTMITGLLVTLMVALFPLGARQRDESANRSRAAALLHRKMEQLRSQPLERLTPDGLSAQQIVDTGNLTSPCSITTVDNLATELPSGSGTVTLTDVADDLVLIDVRIQWSGSGTTAVREVTASTYISDRTPKVETSL